MAEPTPGPAADTIPGILNWAAREHPDTLAVVGPEGRRTYAELVGEVRGLADRLAAIGIGSGSRVAIYLGNGVRWVLSALAVQALGAVVVPVSTWARREELTRIRDRVRPTLMITAYTVVGRDPEAVLAESGLLEADAGFLGAATWGDDLVLPPGTPREATSPTPEDTALILSTSGSTSEPKLVPLLHGDLLRNGQAIGDRQGLRPGDRLWFGAPLFFSYGCANALPVCLTHATALVLQEGLDGNEALALIERERCTAYYGFGPTTRKLVDASDFGGRDLSSLRTGTTGFTEAEKTLVRSTLGVPGVCSVYGMTEAYGHSAMTSWEDSDATFLATQGTVLPTQELRIVDTSTGAVLGRGQQGEIQLRGAVTPGYLGGEEGFTADGWLRTGDIGVLDSADRLQFLERAKSMLKINGINVAPAEIEAVLLDHPRVQQAFVFSEYIDGTEQVVAAVVGDGDTEGLDADLGVFIRDRAASYKVPRRIVFVAAEDVPTTDTGKTNKRRLKALLHLWPVSSERAVHQRARGSSRRRRTTS